jgi:hypothetical protein
MASTAKETVSAVSPTETQPLFVDEVTGLGAGGLADGSSLDGS